MAHYTTIHLHNVPADRRDDYAAWFDGAHRTALAGLRGFGAADRHELADAQVMDGAQPWRFASVYDFAFDTPEIDVPALGPLIADARDAGLIAADDTERLYTYRLFGDWKGSPNWQRDQPLSGVSILLGNYVPGRYDGYQTWYEDVHSVEVANVPGHVAMKRGVLAEQQVESRHYCPGDQPVMTAHQSDDLRFTIGEFVARARHQPQRHRDAAALDRRVGRPHGALFQQGQRHHRLAGRHRLCRRLVALSGARAGMKQKRMIVEFPGAIPGPAHPPVSHNLVGQRLGRKGQETRERILTAMLDLLQDHDGPPVTLTGVAREAAVGMTTLYLYFPDMGDLLLSTLKRVMDSSEHGFVHLLRAYWPDATLVERSRDFLHAHYAFWKRHARLLHMRNSFADGSDARVMTYRTVVSRPVLDLLVMQMDGDPPAVDTMSQHMATVLMVGFERVATVMTNPLFYDGRDDDDADKAAYVGRLLDAQARVIELSIRSQRAAGRQD